MTVVRAMALLVVASTQASRAGAQVRRGDSLLAVGRLVAAESAYYAAARARPRDPESRRQLGRFLGERGALRVGAVLLEEARTFGADAALIARDLVPLYRSLDDFHALVALPSSPLGAGDRAQAAWLVEHPPALEAGDSVVTAYRPSTEGPYIGRVMLRIDGRAVEAVIDPTRRGVAVDPQAAAAPKRRFAARADASIPSIADTVRIGALKLANVPVRIDQLPERIDAAIGLDVFQRFAATFEPRESRVTFHAAGNVPAAMPGIRVPTLTTASEVRVLQGGRWVPMLSGSFDTLLRTKRWTLDARRGAIVVGD